MSYAVRPLQAEDIAQASYIDREAFPAQWPAIAFKQELRDKSAHCLVVCEQAEEHLDHPPPQSDGPRNMGYLQKLAAKMKHRFGKEYPAGNLETNSEYVVGYAILRLRGQSAHLTSIAVQNAYQRRGIGELLLISTIELATAQDTPSVTLEVRASNLAAQKLYKKYSFFEVRRYPGYYSDNGEDALIMYTDTITSISYQAQFQRLKQAYLAKRGKTLMPEFRNQFVAHHTS